MNATINKTNEESFAAGVGFLGGILLLGLGLSLVGKTLIEPSAAVVMLNASALPLIVAWAMRFSEGSSKTTVLSALRYVALALPTLVLVCALVGFAPMNLFGFTIYGSAMLALNILLATGLTSFTFGLLKLGESRPVMEQMDAWLERHETARARLEFVNVAPRQTRNELDEFDRRLQKAMEETELEFPTEENELFSQHFAISAENKG